MAKYPDSAVLPSFFLSLALSRWIECNFTSVANSLLFWRLSLCRGRLRKRKNVMSYITSPCRAFDISIHPPSWLNVTWRDVCPCYFVQRSDSRQTDENRQAHLEQMWKRIDSRATSVETRRLRSILHSCDDDIQGQRYRRSTPILLHFYFILLTSCRSVILCYYTCI